MLDFGMGDLHFYYEIPFGLEVKPDLSRSV